MKVAKLNLRKTREDEGLVMRRARGVFVPGLNTWSPRGYS